MKAYKVILPLILLLLILSPVFARINIHGVDFYLTKGALAPEETRFNRGETVYVVASPPIQGATIEVEVLLIFPPGSGRQPLTLLPRIQVNLQSEKILTQWNVPSNAIEGTYSVRIRAWRPGDPQPTEGELPFEVGSECLILGVPCWLFAVAIILAVGAVAVVVTRKPTPPTGGAGLPEIEARGIGGAETVIVREPGTIAIKQPSGETITVVAHLEAGGRMIPIDRLPRVYGREDFRGLVTGETLNVISRRHFEIGYDYTQGSFYIMDLGSKNGTYLNGEDIRGKGRVSLKNGDTISVAGVLNLRFATGPGSSPPSLF
ncbi:FHA domain-containing protein [Infirmifilum lucidum]|nr:FHA domain-containing protein [Infirmifilum lucidum]